MSQKNAIPPSTESSTKATQSARELFLKKKHGSVHPKAVAEYAPLRRVRIPRLNNEEAYGSLTNESTYSEYAWAFLRRNRFYQRFIDEGSHYFKFADWGFFSHEKSRPSFGLDRVKPYHESFSYQTPVRWNGIHNFRDRLVRARPLAQGLLDIDKPQTQVAIVFDIDALLGDNTTALEQQISMATIHLNALARASGIQHRPKGIGPQKPLLRAQLRAADLISSPAIISRATEPAQGRPALRSEDDGEDDEDAAISLQISDVATEFLPNFDVKRISSNGDAAGNIDQLLSSFGTVNVTEVNASKTQLVGRTSELIVKAWDNIYNWRFMNWLQYDDWDHLVPRKTRTITAHKD